jgi:RIO kinase 1
MSNKINLDDYLDDDFDAAQPLGNKKHRGRRILPTGKADRVKYVADLIEVSDKVEIDLHQNFSPTFSSSSHERYWILNYLESFYTDQVISDVLWKVKGGKEANVYCCAAHPSTGLELIAAKIYRPRMFRNLRNDARYRQGRELRDEQGKVTHNRREMLAMKKNTRFGKELRHVSWLEAEFLTLTMLNKAGVDVPRVISHGENVILMEFFGDRTLPAPALNEVTLPQAEARVIFDRLVENLAIMLEHHCVHGDFSAYNVLYWDGDFRIIDFPQAVDPRHNPDAHELFVRDIERLCQYFRRYGIRQNGAQLAADLWETYHKVNALDAGASMVEDELGQL